MASSRPSDFALTSAGPLRLFSTNELLRLPPPEWLVDTILPAGGLVGLYGPPGHGKSFIAIDVAFAVASSRPWHTHTTLPGHVLYVSAEGGHGISRRAAAWLAAHSVQPGNVNMAWLTEALPIYGESESIDRLMFRLENEALRCPTLIIVDTLARCFEGNENETEDMGRFIQGIDKLRREYGATVLIVHHTRLDGDRERGNTALRGAADTMIAVERSSETKHILMTCNKQRDAEEFPMLRFELTPIPGTDSCALRPAGTRKLEIIEEILANGALSFTSIKVQARAQGVSPATTKRALVSLVENGKIIKENSVYWLSEGSQKTGQ